MRSAPAVAANRLGIRVVRSRSGPYSWVSSVRKASNPPRLRRSVGLDERHTAEMLLGNRTDRATTTHPLAGDGLHEAGEAACDVPEDRYDQQRERRELPLQP